MRRPSNTTGKQMVSADELLLADPRLNRLTGLLRQFKLDRLRGLLLQDRGSRRSLATLSYVPHLHFHDVAAAQLAIDGVSIDVTEQRELPQYVPELVRCAGITSACCLQHPVRPTLPLREAQMLAQTGQILA